MSEKYGDIIRFSRPVSVRHLPMSRLDRAAQFSPFAALTGYDGVIQETARLTDSAAELDESRKAELDAKLRSIQADIRQMPQVTVTYFQEDHRKSGGAYVTVTARVKRVNEYTQALVFQDGRTVDLNRIYHIY